MRCGVAPRVDEQNGTLIGMPVPVRRKELLRARRPEHKLQLYQDRWLPLHVSQVAVRFAGTAARDPKLLQAPHPHR